MPVIHCFYLLICCVSVALSGQQTANPAQYVAMAFEFYPVNAGALACFTEEADAAGFELVVRPEVRLLVLDKGAVLVAFHVHASRGMACWRESSCAEASVRVRPDGPPITG